MAAPSLPTTPTVRELRRRWKPHKQRLYAGRADHPTLIRFHRACSWLARVEAMDLDSDGDLVLVSRWIAFNSLYGQWDHGEREPLPDRECWRVFLQRLVALDRTGHLAGTLTVHKRLVLTIQLACQWLTARFAVLH